MVTRKCRPIMGRLLGMIFKGGGGSRLRSVCRDDLGRVKSREWLSADKGDRDRQVVEERHN